MTHRITIKGYSMWKGGWHSVTVESDCRVAAEEQVQANLVWFDGKVTITRVTVNNGAVIDTTAEPMEAA